MKIQNPEYRLSKFWGKVDTKHIKHIADFVIGTTVLDMGCGYGTTTNFLTQKGLHCVGIDYDSPTIAKAQARFPTATFKVANAEKLPFENDSFDTIILRDALHHFLCEANFEKVQFEILRVAKPNARILFFDPNINTILKIMRKLSRHIDEECTYDEAIKIVNEMNCTIIHSSFNTIFSLPLSGGYVGINFIPNIGVLHTLLLKLESIAEKIANKLHISKIVCWRYIIVGEVNNQN